MVDLIRGAKLLPLITMVLVSCAKTPERKLEFVPGTDRNFGGVEILSSKVERLVLSNVGKQSVQIVKLEMSDGHNGQFAILSSGTCKVGDVIEKAANCTVDVEYTPAHDVSITDSVEVTYSKVGTSSDSEVPTKLASVVVRGHGILNCEADPALVAAYEAGEAAAVAKMDQDVIDATNLANSKTYADGYAVGHGQTYSAAYAEGYDHETQGYPAGYVAGFDNGYADGIVDTNACDAGRVDATADAEVDAENDARIVGLEAGHAVGYADGSPIGFDDGYDHEIYVCENPDFVAASSAALVSSHTSSLRVQVTDEHTNKCEDRGYQATYSRDPYNNAYDTALAANQDYQRGIREGRTQGRTEGLAAGKAQGYSDGFLDGDHDGLKAGQDEFYAECYESRYPVKYDDFYVEFYDVYSDLAYDAGLNDGYVAGYFAGQYAGFEDCNGYPAEEGYFEALAEQEAAGAALPLTQEKSLIKIAESVNEHNVSSTTLNGQETKVYVGRARLSRIPHVLKEIDEATYFNLNTRFSSLRNHLQEEGHRRMTSRKHKNRPNLSRRGRRN